MNNDNRVFLLGDLHGNIEPIYEFLKLSGLTFNKNNKATLILLGDSGLNYYEPKKSKKIKQKFNELPINIIILRGNHEQRASILAKRNKKDWKKIIYFDNEMLVEKEFPNIKYMLDCPAVYNINGYKTLCIPGAYSVDKYYRIKNKLIWFNSEQLNSKEMEKGTEIVEKNNYTFDLILSHTCPIQYEPTELFLSFIDQSQVDKTMELWMGDLVDKGLKSKLWCFGHFHGCKFWKDYETQQQLLMLYNTWVIEINDWMESLPYKLGSLF